FNELNFKHALHERVSLLLREEEIKWYQRAKVKNLLEGDANTKFFHLVANGKHRKVRIFTLDQEDGTITRTVEFDDIPQVSPQENDLLSAPFTVEEVRAAIFQMEHNKAPGPDGFPPEFYQIFWDWEMLAKYNKYRSICLLNVSFTIFTKLATNRIVKVAHKIIRASQTAFLPNIMEGAVVLHETLHELHRKNLNRVIFKIDFEKAYDKTLRMKGFSATWCNWIKSFVQGENVAVNVNGQNGSYFQTRKGLRQGDPLSPILFNTVVNMLAIIINRAKTEGKVNGVIPHLVEDGLSILQYVDDTVIFLDHDLEMAKNMKILLCVFEKLSDLKINFHKSEIFCFGQTKECENAYSELFGCKSGSFPFTYIGLPMYYRKLRNSDWRHIEERFEKRLIGWKGKLLSVGGRLVLINSVLSSLSMFMLSFFAISKGVLRKLEYFRSRFFWQNDLRRNTISLNGIRFVNLKNKGKPLYKLANEDGIWQRSLRNKYLKSEPLGGGVKRPGVSHFWTGLMDMKQEFLSLGSFSIGDGTQFRFWEDAWCGNRPLKFLYPSLFKTVRKKGATMADVMRSIPLNISFRRGLYGERLNAWNELVGRVMNLELREGSDVFNWGLNKTDVFTVRLMYKHLVNNGITVSPKIWQTKITLKTKIFMWYVKKGTLFTKDNLARRNWNGYQGCCFCSNNESI
ncbi:LOW QUALITY PROTEIN: hypothetical protein U9M48_038369, partial [Paspalum notatum var. saurae]